ncbi:hypothetical protein [Mesorhizobium loti]|uniref:hypothetical protein n=1 Tax=Rhizobium loti TaxID=381 RepID=UPI001475F41A|nr:hypothetical protein [Mesorhizobium loti]
MSLVIGGSFESGCVSNPTLPKNIDDRRKAARSLATALLRARSRAASLPPSYTTSGDATLVEPMLIQMCEQRIDLPPIQRLEGCAYIDPARLQDFAGALRIFIPFMHQGSLRLWRQSLWSAA